MQNPIYLNVLRQVFCRFGIFPDTPRSAGYKITFIKYVKFVEHYHLTFSLERVESLMQDIKKFLELKGLSLYYWKNSDGFEVYCTKKFGGYLEN